MKIITIQKLFGENIRNKILMIIPKPIAHRKFAAGPAKEVSKISLLGFRKYIGLIGTGFAQPKRNRNRLIVPIKSKCFKGFNVSRPADFAVGSPNRKATKPCAYS